MKIGTPYVMSDFLFCSDSSSAPFSQKEILWYEPTELANVVG